jgi:hypothetical protein
MWVLMQDIRKPLCLNRSAGNGSTLTLLTCFSKFSENGSHDQHSSAWSLCPKNLINLLGCTSALKNHHLFVWTLESKPWRHWCPNPVDGRIALPTMTLMQLIGVTSHASVNRKQQSSCIANSSLSVLLFLTATHLSKFPRHLQVAYVPIERTS